MATSGARRPRSRSPPTTGGSSTCTTRGCGGLKERARSASGSPPRKEVGVAMAVIKTIDLVGVSSESWRDAAVQALAEAAKTIRGIESMDILGTSAVVADGQISEYHTQVRISFRIERS